MAASTAESPQREGTTRERLLRVAIEMFAERGYAATGVDALCRRAGVAKTGLYWEFQNKAGLLAAVIDRVVEESVMEIVAAAQLSGEPRERLALAISAMKSYVGERPELFRVLLVVLAERTQVDEETRDALRGVFDRAREAIAQGIQGVLTTQIPAEDLNTVATLVMAMVQGLFLRSQVYPGDQDLDRLFQGVQSAVLLLVREAVASAHGQSFLSGPVSGYFGKKATD